MTNYRIFETKRTLKKKPGTKTVWTLNVETYREVEDGYVKMVEESCGFFRRLGGSETITRGYTSRGYRMTKLVSTSPDKSIRIVRTFKIEENQ